MKITNDCVVSIHYTLTNDVGQELASSANRGPMSYLHGADNIISGLEGALENRMVGDEFHVTVQPEQGYGHVDRKLMQAIPRSTFDAVENLQAGMQLKFADSNGKEHRVRVRGVGEQMVSVDGNHPLAGQILHFEVKVESVRAATAEEIARGHSH